MNLYYNKEHITVTKKRQKKAYNEIRTEKINNAPVVT